MNTTSRYTTPKLERQRQQLEALMHPRVEGKAGLSRLVQALQTLAHRFVNALVAPSDLHIWQHTIQGRQTWFAHDPVTNQTRRFCTEEDLRIWLDQRYYE